MLKTYNTPIEWNIYSHYSDRYNINVLFNKKGKLQKCAYYIY